jgi:DNA-binding winged helix-turn-helix (wHTH) protein
MMTMETGGRRQETGGGTAVLSPVSCLLSPPERQFRGPGCGDGCRVVRALLPGVFGRSELLLHDPEAHEDYGRRSVAEREPDVLLTGPLCFDFERLAAYVDGRFARLTATELRIVRALGRRPGRLVEVPALVAEIWGPGWADGLAWEKGAHILRVNVSRTRAKLGPAAYLLVTVTGLGYRLELDVPTVERPAPEAALALERHAVLWAPRLGLDGCRDCGRSYVSHYAGGRCTACRRRARSDDEKGLLP